MQHEQLLEEEDEFCFEYIVSEVSVGLKELELQRLDLCLS